MIQLCKKCEHYDDSETLIRNGEHLPNERCSFKNVSLNNSHPTHLGCSSFNISEIATPKEKYEALIF